MFDKCQTIAYLIYRSSIGTANQTNINAIHALQITVIDWPGELEWIVCLGWVVGAGVSWWCLNKKENVKW